MVPAACKRCRRVDARVAKESIPFSLPSCIAAGRTRRKHCSISSISSKAMRVLEMVEYGTAIYFGNYRHCQPSGSHNGTIILTAQYGRMASARSDATIWTAIDEWSKEQSTSRAHWRPQP